MSEEPEEYQTEDGAALSGATAPRLSQGESAEQPTAEPPASQPTEAVEKPGRLVGEPRPRRRRRRKIRQRARECYIQAGGDIDKAEDLLRATPDYQAIDPATILLILKIAYELWKWWQARNITEPPERPEQGEPPDEIYAY